MCPCVAVCCSVCSSSRRAGSAAAEIDEDSAARGSESVIRLPERLAEKRGVEGGRKKKEKKGRVKDHGVTE